MNIRANIDVDITCSTRMRLNVMGKIAETNRANYGDIYNILYNTPSAAFPIRYDDDGLYGGTSIYGANNPVALLMDSGNYRQTIGMLLGDLSLRQNLDALTPRPLGRGVGGFRQCRLHVRSGDEDLSL